ncbi:MAG: endonuclease III [Christensenellales bacterium]|jgi:endonuclease-3
MLNKKAIGEVLRALSETYSDVRSGLDFSSPFELLIATILAAQCTDVRVNKVTPGLFARYPTPQAMAACPLEEMEDIIRTCGMYHTKAKNILLTCQILTDKYGGAVPDTMEELTGLPGVGRKTANVVLAFAFGKPAIAVDTHVFRVSNRIGLADAKNVLKTEEHLMKNIPEDTWSTAHHWLIWHGRRVCSSQRPKCEACTLTPWCKHYKSLTRPMPAISIRKKAR